MLDINEFVLLYLLHIHSDPTTDSFASLWFFHIIKEKTLQSTNTQIRIHLSID